MKFLKGERVRAKWPGSSQYFLGTIIEAGDSKCEVKFDEGTSYSVLTKYIYRELTSSPTRKSTNSMSDRSPSRKSSVERSALKSSVEHKPSVERLTRKSSTERLTRKASTERTVRKTSTERAVRKSSMDRAVRKSSSERSVSKFSVERLPVKPAERSPSRTADRELARFSQQSPSRPAIERQRPSRSPGRLKITHLPKPPAVVTADNNARTTFERTSVELSTKEVSGDQNSPFTGSITRLEDRAKELSAKLGAAASRSESNYESSTVKSSFLSQVSARRSLRGMATSTTSTPISSGLTMFTTSTPTSLGLVQQSVLTNGSFSDDDDDLSGESERVVTTTVVKEVVEERMEEHPIVEGPIVSSAVDLLHSIRESSVLRNSVPPEDRPRQWSLEPTTRSSASLRGSVRRSIIREVDSNSVHGSVTGGRDYAELLKREGRMLAFVPPDYIEWGGVAGCALWILLLPLALLALHLCCDEVSCDMGWRVLNIPLAWQAYLDLIALVIVLCFVGVQGALCVLPIGYQVDLIPNTWGCPKYRCSGLLSAVLCLAGVSTVKYVGYSFFAISSRYLQLLVASVLFSVVLSVVLYLQGSSANPYVRHRGFLYTFWAGREVYPQFWRLHIKALLSKISLVGSLVLSLVLLLEGVDWASGPWPTTLVVFSTMLGLYLVDSLWFEEGALTSFSMLYEGCGYMTAMLHCVYPFLVTLPLRYHLLHRPELSYYTLILLLAVFLVGFFLYRFSNSQKDKFRKNPLDPAIAHLETVPSSLPRTRKLLVSSYWGFVRHPNYLGDIIMHFALTCTCGLAPALPYALLLCLLGVLLHRASRDGARCGHRYGSDWKRYCSTVKYKVIPYVY